ncbi:hypothetical protein BH92_27035 (plasmid) [Rhodococcoides fascians A21d2]|uniref:hypothetical protein n=1 Tax=Rhodococcoides fascians TaxID=1828 RepID=UPI00068FE19F|nr:hypothetical protein [Rhodococcus fascians]QII03715.1 hypothetical protein BH92_27035 [Rhodococcus fascians A21d2]
MAPRDRTDDTNTDDDTDDWFAEPVVAETNTAAAASVYPTERRLTVLTEHEAAEVEPDDDWFDGPSAETDVDRPGLSPTALPRDGYGSFDARTSVLRAGGPYAAPSPPQSWWRRRRAAVAVTAALTVVIGAVTGTGLVLSGFGEEPQPPAMLLPDEIVTTTTAPTSTAPAAAGAAAADVTWCRGQANGDPVTDDSADPGALAIWRFEKAFYFDRDGAAARAAGAPDAVMASAQRLQAGIDQLEADIEFCVLADPIDAGIYDVTVVERGPGIDGRTSRQRITTTKQQDGATLISAIASR